MIAYLTGVIGEKLEQGCLLLTDSGVGYEVHLPGHTLAQLPGRGERVELYVCTVVREDAIELFGTSGRPSLPSLPFPKWGPKPATPS